MLKRITDNPKVTILTDTVVKTWLGEDSILTGAILKNLSDDSSEYRINCDGAFIAIGHRPMTSFLDNQVRIIAHNQRLENCNYL